MNKFNKDSVSRKELIMEFYIKNNKQQVIKIENESSRRTTQLITGNKKQTTVNKSIIDTSVPF